MDEGGWRRFPWTSWRLSQWSSWEMFVAWIRVKTGEMDPSEHLPDRSLSRHMGEDLREKIKRQRTKGNGHQRR